MMASTAKTMFTICVIVAVLGAGLSAITFLGYAVRYSRHDSKLGRIPYDDYLELTSMTLTEKYFLTVGSLSFLAAAAAAAMILVRAHRRLSRSSE